MNNLRESINYNEITVCPHCQSQILYHVTDIKGVNEKFIICPTCHKRVDIQE